MGSRTRDRPWPDARVADRGAASAPDPVFSYPLLTRPTLPACRPERRRRQPLLVAQVRVGDLAPAEPHLRRLLDVLRRDDDGFALDRRLRGVELAVLAGDLE